MQRKSSLDKDKFQKNLVVKYLTESIKKYFINYFCLLKIFWFNIKIAEHYIFDFEFLELIFLLLILSIK